jgi:hypothetical protein
MSTTRNTTEIGRIDTNTTELRHTRLTFSNSVVELEVWPVGTIARITRDDGHRGYAGPLDEATIGALREVGSE